MPVMLLSTEDVKRWFHGGAAGVLDLQKSAPRRSGSYLDQNDRSLNVGPTARNVL